MIHRVETLLEDSVTWVLIVAHPGHELRAYHVLERVKPTVAVLTDGSGAAGASRLEESRALLANMGARPAPMFGPLTDREAYAALVAADSGPFATYAIQLANLLIAERVRVVAVDAAEGYNPVHDVCHWMGRAAVERARQSGAVIDLFELDLISHPDGDGTGLRVRLDDEAFARKLAATAAYEGLRAEADAAFERYGRSAFRVEFLRRIGVDAVPPQSWVPYYERVGEARVSSGRYTSVLRYAAHVRPVIIKLLELTAPAAHAKALRPLHQ